MKRTESYSAAAARRSYECLMIERAATAKARRADSGPAALAAARRLSCPKGSEPGAFSATACITERYDTDLRMFIEPAALRPLPRAVLVHLGHDITKRAVAVGVPTFADGVVGVDCVFSSSARDAWARVQSGEVRSTSIYAHLQEYHRGIDGRLVNGTLIAVDLVRSGADKSAHLTKLVPGAELTPAQRQVQHRLDRFLNDPLSPRAIDLLARADRLGTAALEPLRSIVAPLFEDCSEPRSSRRPAAPVVTRSVTERRCGATMDGLRCDHPAGHGGMHFGEAPDRCAAWDDRLCGRRSALDR